MLVTGHTGFKGAWLALWLQSLGARVTGFALAPETSPSLFELLRLAVDDEIIGDLRDAALVAAALRRFDPQIVIHMAAQALVQPSYVNPVGTFATNVLGLAHLLEAARYLGSLQAVLVVTTDKVYENREDGRPFGEGDRLGGRDPYSSSKACAELVASCFRDSFFDAEGAAAVATARAGNVVGGGDWSAFRLVPDVVRACERSEPVILRQPHAVRPWQHVLEPLYGYLLYAQALVERGATVAGTLNFAPAPGSSRTVAEVVEALSAAFGGRPGWTPSSLQYPHEAKLLALSPAKAEAVLGWRPQLDFATTMAWTAEWFKGFWRGDDVRALVLAQIEAYAERLAEPPQVPAFAAPAGKVLSP